MSYQQVRSPNLNPYIYQEGKLLTDWYGWCLAYVQTAFAAGWAGSNAWEAWSERVNVKHGDMNLPGGVYVPIWFSGYGGLGHVAIYKDGQVTSSPWHHKATPDVMSSIAETERIYGVTYVGWSEDIGGTTVIQSVPDAPLYSITAITPKQMTVLPNHEKWNLAQPNFDAVVANPIVNSGTGTDFTAVATLTRADAGFEGYTYLLDDANTPHGWNSLDCTNYVAPAPTPDPVTLATPAPKPPSAPMTINFQTTPISIVTKIPGYMAISAALNHSGAGIVLDVGNYLLYETDSSGMQHVAKTPSAIKYWINPADNVKAAPPATPVVPSPTAAATSWKNTLTPLLTSGKSIKFRILRDVYVTDMANPSAKGVELNESTDDKNTWIPIRYWLVRSNMTYLVPFLSSDAKQEHFYAIPTTDIDSGLPNLESELYKPDADTERTYRKQQGRETFDDRVYDVNQAISKMVKSGLRFMDLIKVKVTKK